MSPQEENAVDLEKQNNEFLDGSNIIDLEYQRGWDIFKESEEYKALLYGAIPKSERGREVKPVRNSKVNPKIHNNEPCPCGRGNKFKKCCKTIKNEQISKLNK